MKRFETLGLIEKTVSNKKRVLSQLERARRDLLTSGANLPIDEEWAYTIAYTETEKSLKVAGEFVREIAGRVETLV